MITDNDKLFEEVLKTFKETLEIINKVYGNSAYYHHIDYKATNDKYQNWLRRARDIIKNAERPIQFQKDKVK